MKPVNHDPQTLTTTSFSTISAKGCRLGRAGGFLKADIYGAEHWARVLLNILQILGWISRRWVITNSRREGLS